MYFKNRAEAGRLIASKLEKYKAQNIVVVALDEGSSIVAAQIAIKLHANLVLYMIKNIYLPGENQAIASMSSTGTYVLNDYFSAGELEELTTEYHGFLDQKRMEVNHELHMLMGRDGEVDKNLLRHRVVIVVADGLPSGFALKVCSEFLKTIAIKKIVAVTPIASVQAVDVMHLIADELVCLNVAPNFMGTNHYYEDKSVPKIEGVLKIMKNITLSWERVPPKASPVESA
jgi:predicted phosphoribosyltransferase